MIVIMLCTSGYLYGDSNQYSYVSKNGNKMTTFRIIDQNPTSGIILWAFDVNKGDNIYVWNQGPCSNTIIRRNIILL